MTPTPHGLPRIAARTLWARKRRLFGLVLAVVLGTAFLSGTLTMADTLDSSVTGLLRANGAGTDVVVRNAASVTDKPGTQRAGIDAQVVDAVRAVPGVADAQPVIDGYGQLVGKDGKQLTGNGPRTAGNWITDPALDPWHLAEGRAPVAPDEVVVDKASARQGHLKPGDHITVLTPQPVPVTVVGIARFGDVDAFGGGSYTAFSLEGARRYVARDPAQVTTVSVRAQPGVTQRQLADEIQRVVPPGVQALPGAAATQEAVDAVQQGFLTLFRTFLTAFAVIALVVAAFSISHTFSVVTAQRTREAALLRALGASRRQVRGQALLEALALGTVASGIGFGAGLGLTKGLEALFSAAGLGLPANGLDVTATTAAVVLGVGIVVTVGAALVPAVRASRVPPVTAMRSVAAEDPDVPRRRTVAGTAAVAAGVALTASAALGTGGTWVMVLGGLATVAGVLLAAPAGVKAAGRVLTAPLPRLRPVAGALARGNVLRSPRRTAGAATAMVVGIAVVAVFAVVAASLRDGTGDRTREVLGGQVVIGGSSPAGWAGGGNSPELTRLASALPGVEAATGIQGGDARVGSDTVSVTAVDSAHLDDVLRLDVHSGSDEGLTPGTIAVSASAAAAHGWTVGSSVPVTYPDGAQAHLRVAGIYGRTALVGDYLLDRTAWAPHAVTDVDRMAVLKAAPGTSVATVKAEAKALAARFGAPAVDDAAGFVKTQTSTMDAMLTIVYALLALALVIALGGIANTLSLAVHERTRELGLLRAVGATRGQVRSALRWESGLTAALGAATGLGLGVFLGWGAVRTFGASQHLPVTLPVTQLVVLVLVGALGGLVAGARPAARAAKLDVLTAVQAD